jgi:hypothetical protein
MPSPEHQVFIDLVRTDPRVVTDLLTESGDLHAPRGTTYEIAESTFSELKSIDFHADLALKVPDDAPREAENVLFEAQLSIDVDKPLSWPVYLSMFRRQHKRGAVLVVATTEQSVADWIGSEIALSSDGSKIVVHVLGPATWQPGSATAMSQTHPAFAVIAGLAHASEPGAFPVVRAALDGLQKALETYMTVEGYEFKSELLRNNYAAGRAEGEKAGRSEGEKEGIRKGLMLGIKRAVSTRGLVLSAEQLGRIESCLDEGQLETWLVRAWTAQAAVDLFDA